MKTFAAIYKGNRTIELSEDVDLPENTSVLVVIPGKDDDELRADFVMHQKKHSKRSGIMKKTRFGMNIYRQRDIVLVPFPFSDLSTPKVRPVLVLSNDAYNRRTEDLLVC